jgi:hypothetical protein
LNPQQGEPLISDTRNTVNALSSLFFVAWHTAHGIRNAA